MWMATVGFLRGVRAFYDGSFDLAIELIPEGSAALKRFGLFYGNPLFRVILQECY
ncbi:MAG: hypothetical protein ACI8P9_002373 [Parasphingorhabdus sp.]|jgi:hypothetical protein